MTIREAAEVLYDEYTGTTGRLGNSTQEARWIAFTEKVIRVAGVERVAWRKGMNDTVDAVFGPLDDPRDVPQIEWAQPHNPYPFGG